MRQLFILGVLATLAFSCGSKKTSRETKKTSATIQESMEFLTSDALQGRNTGTEGIDKAATYIENRFRESGIEPYYETYRDAFEVKGMQGFNVVGVLPGNDETLKKEVVLIGAHYDHIGFGKPVGTDSIANGANDNASGTTTVLALADHFAKAKSNKRTLVFALFSAEEMGLVGSKHLAERMHKEQVDLYTVFNIEMVGVPMKDKDHLVYLTGYELSNYAEKFNAYAGSKVVGFLPKAQEFRLFLRSDNYPFYNLMNIPAQTISSFDFTNFEHYHGVGDEASLMDYNHMETVVQAVIPGIEGMANSTTKEIVMKPKTE